jgi:hypothetical protein
MSSRRPANAERKPVPSVLPVSDLLVLAAVSRADRHSYTNGAPWSAIAQHLGFRRGTPRVGTLGAHLDDLKRGKGNARDWARLSITLQKQCAQLGWAIYCLQEWEEPDDAHADIAEGDRLRKLGLDSGGATATPRESWAA